MAFLFCIIIILLIICISTFILIKSTIQITVKNYKYNSLEKGLSKNKKETDIVLRLIVFNKIPILKLNLTNKKIKKVKMIIKENKKLKKLKADLIKKLQTTEKYEIKDLLKGDKEEKIIAKRILKSFIKLVDIKQINLEILIGRKSMNSTIAYVMIISTIMSMIFLNNIKDFKNKENRYVVNPAFINRNITKIELEGIFETKLLHIINIINDMKKMRRVSKNVRSSNRRSYDYSYE